jgi:predicted Zn-dependent protease
VSDTNIPAILSTHPLPDERIKEIENLIQHDIYKPKKNLELDTIFTSLKSPKTSIK